MSEIRNIENLLNQVNTIRTSYERVARATGENFNIFSVLGLERNEVKAHSAFISHLLNAQGKHGFGHAFLDVFVSIVKTKNFENIEFTKESQDNSDYNFKTENSYVKKEHYVGNVNVSQDLSKSAGGNIDILIREKSATNKVIMIENKIDAGDQPHQLLRYHNAFPNGLLIYLTLDNKISSEKSAKTFPYKCMSYENDIVNWLEECQKIAFDNPTLRETIKQYRNLVKKLTNQNINSEMDKEILDLIIKNKKETDIIINTFNSLQNRVKHKYENIVGKLIKMDIKELSSFISITKQKQGKFLRWEDHYHYSFNLSSDNQDYNVGIFKYDNDSNIYFTTSIDGQEKKSFAHDTSEDKIYEAFLVFLKEAISIMEKKDL